MKKVILSVLVAVPLFLPVLASAQTATLLHDGDRVMATPSLNIRSTPSTSGTVIGRTPSDLNIISLGTVRCNLAGSTACPATASGYYWWHIDWDSSTLPTGWSTEESSGDLYVASVSLLELYARLYSLYSGNSTTPEDLSQALIDIHSPNPSIAVQAVGFVLNLVASGIGNLFVYLMGPDLSTGYWNNPIKGALYSNATAGVETANLALDLLYAEGLNNIPPLFLVAQVSPITNSLAPYYATAQGGTGAIKASDTVTGGTGSMSGEPYTGDGTSPEQYTANFTRAQQGLTTLVEYLLNHAVTYETLGSTPVIGNWAWQTMDLANPLQDFYNRGAAKYDAEGSKLMNAYILACYGPPEWTKDYTEWGGYPPMAYISGTNFSEPYPAPPADATPAALFTTAKGSGEIEGAQAEILITSMYGGPLWTALGRMGVGGQTMQNLIQQHFDPWATVRTWDPNIISGYVNEVILRDPQTVNLPVWPVCDRAPSQSPSVASTKFIIGNRIQTTATLNVRQIPSINGAVLGTQATGAYGVVTGGPTSADGYNWWNINYDTAPDGWSAENYLLKASQSTPPPPTPTPPPPPVPTPPPPTPEPTPASTVTTMSTLLSGLRNLYSPSVLTVNGIKKMWLGGWLTNEDVGPDKLYLSSYQNGSWTWPQPINWTNAGYSPGVKPGYHINDPSVIHPPSSDGIDRSQWLYMYYTGLSNTIAGGPETQWSANHEIGFASSVDGGATWTDHGIIVASAASGDGHGAWSPSAIVVGSEIWLYYHTGTLDFTKTINFRQRLNANGWQTLATAERLSFPENISFNSGANVTLLSNIDVSLWNGRYVLLANTTDLLNVVRFSSSDGLTWRKTESNPKIIQGGINHILTPNFESITSDSYRVYFGYGAPDDSTSIQAWDFSTGDVPPPPPPLSTSNKFIVGDRVQTTATVNVRATPSTSGVLLGTQPTGSLGAVIGGPVVANGYNWWNVNYDTAPDGWGAENYLKNAGAGVAPPPLSQSSGTIIWQIKKDGVLQSNSSVVVNGTTPVDSPKNLTVPSGSYPGAPAGTYTYTYVSGGPAEATFQNITPSGTQTLTTNGNITFTFNFVSSSSEVCEYPAPPAGYHYEGGKPYPDCGAYLVKDNSDIDTTSPAVSLTAPVNGSTVSGAITISASALDNVGVTKVEFFADGTLKSTDTSSPYSYSWDTTLSANGTHTLYAKAYDASHNVGQSSIITVTVSNTGLTSNNASCGAITAPLSVTPGQVFSASVTVTNTGTKPWVSPQYWLSAVNSTAGSWVDRWVAGGGLDLPFSPVSPGQSATFNFTATAPTTAGTYGFSWQMIQEGIEFFGPMCQVPITVASTGATDTTQPTVSITSPANGATVSGLINVYADAADNVGVTKVEFSVDGLLKATVTQNPYFFSWLATPLGSHTFTAKAYDAAGNVGQSSAVTVNVPTAITNSSQFISQSVPSSMVAGQSYPVSVTMKNIGTNTWTPIGPQINAYRLRSVNPVDNFNWNTSARAELSNTVPASGQVTINFTVIAPTTPGTYNFQWRMLQEGVQEFGAYTTNVPVVVVSATNTDVTPPTISITSPANGATVSGLVNASVNAQDNVGIAKVEYYVDGYFMTSISQSPYSASFVVQLGTHTLTAKAYDTANNIGQSQPVSVNILVPITNSSQFISQSVPATMITGQSYPVSVTMKNIGMNNWDLTGPQVNAYRLRSENPVDNYTWNVNGRAELSAPVNAGGQGTINFTVTAPTTAGIHNFQWRMVQEGVQEFGQFTQNIPVVVSSVSAGDIISPAVSIISPASGVSVSGPISVYATASDNVGVVKVEFYVDSVLKGSSQQDPFSFTWNSLLSLPGSHTLIAKAYDAVGNVGQSSAVTVNVPTAITNSAQFISQSIPSSMVAGQAYSVSVTMKNTGTNTWTPIGPQINAYRLGSVNPTDNLIWGLGRAELPNAVPAGGQVTINFTVTAPNAPSTYNFQWRMVQEGVQWFGLPSQKVVVGVVSASQLSTATVRYRATLNGALWSGPLHFTSKDVNSTAAPWDGTLTFPADIPNAPAGITWIETYVSGGPSGATFSNITPSATQSITSGDITFTFNFVGSQSLSDGSALNFASALSGMAGILERMKQLLKVSWP